MVHASHLRTLAACGVLLTLLLPGTRIARAEDGRVSFSPVYPFGSFTGATGWSQVVRQDKGISMVLHTSKLPANTADTVWWVIFNHPENCHGTPGVPLRCTDMDFGRPAVAASILYATGALVGADGMANFQAHLDAGTTTGALFGPGLLEDSINTADIHLVVRTHGAPIPGRIQEQTGTFNGGCPPNMCYNVQASPHEAQSGASDRDD